MIGAGTLLAIAAWTLALAVGVMALGAGLFALSMWLHSVDERLARASAVRSAAMRLVGEIYGAQFRYRAGHDICIGAQRELP